MSRGDDMIERLRAAAATGGKTSKSSLRRWLEANHDAFAEMLESTGPRPNWKAIAETLSQGGLTDAGGNPPTAATARNAWWKAKGEVARGKGLKEARRAAQAPPPAPAAKPPIPAAPPPAAKIQPAAASSPASEKAPTTGRRFRPTGGLKRWDKGEADDG